MFTAPNIYVIVATVETDNGDGWTGSRQIPTFLLNGDVQGITSEDHAAKVARDIIDPIGRGRVHITATKFDADPAHSARIDDLSDPADATRHNFDVQSSMFASCVCGWRQWVPFGSDSALNTTRDRAYDVILSLVRSHTDD